MISRDDTLLALIGAGVILSLGLLVDPPLYWWLAYLAWLAAGAWLLWKDQP